MSAEFSGNDTEFFEAWQSLTYGSSTRVNKRLPPAPAAPEIPARSGEAPHVVNKSSAGGAVNLTLKGAKVLTSADGMITIAYPETAEVVIGATTIVLPAISKS